MKLVIDRHSRKIQLAACVLIVVGCAFSLFRSDAVDVDDPSNGLFPLIEGKTWVYQVSTEMSDPNIEESLTLSVDRKIDFEDLPTWVRRSADGAEYYIRRDSTGIYRVARRTDLEEHATKDPSPRYILKTPVQIGDSWDGGVTVPYLIRRPNQVPNDLRHSHKAIMTFHVEAANEEVEVPLAKYSGCVHVVGQARLHLFTDPINGFSDVPLISHEWYCPRVGLVKFSREEIVPGQFMTGGKVTYSLSEMY